MVNRHLISLNAAPYRLFTKISAPLGHVYVRANMTEVAPKNAEQRYEIPADWTIPDFLRRAVAEAKLVIAEIDKAQAEMDEPKTA
jgi:hypothetical protein